MTQDNPYTCWLEDIGSEDVARVGGKNGSLGEMIRALKDEGIRVPDGFATTAEAYRAFLEANDLPQKIQATLNDLSEGRKSLVQAGKSLRRLFRQAEFPNDVSLHICHAYRDLSRRYGTENVDVAVRSSATAEDLPEASFAGQQETYLNITGEDDLLEACRDCFASLFTDRAISYRQEKGFDHLQVALSIGIQKMVRSDSASAGVAFTLDPETGFPDAVVINATWGLGETVVQGHVTPDQYVVFKPLLYEDALQPIVDKSLGTKEQKMVYSKSGSTTTKIINTSKAQRQAFVLEDDAIVQLARWACSIERHYGKPMDIEWAKDGETDEIFIVQARPETVQSQKNAGSLKTYTLNETSQPLLTGLSIGDAIAAANVCLLKDAGQIDQFEDGAILVTAMTDPDWVPIMKRAKGIITDYGGRTSHAAIVSRELGVPAIIGTGEATEVLHHAQDITLSCAEGDVGTGASLR
jgi:pyruvate,water dikinase